MKWEVTSVVDHEAGGANKRHAEEDTARLESLLAAGWEPFAVVSHVGGGGIGPVRLYLRLPLGGPEE